MQHECLTAVMLTAQSCSAVKDGRHAPKVSMMRLVHISHDALPYCHRLEQCNEFNLDEIGCELQQSNHEALAFVT